MKFLCEICASKVASILVESGNEKEARLLLESNLVTFDFIKWGEQSVSIKSVTKIDDKLQLDYFMPNYYCTASIGMKLKDITIRELLSISNYSVINFYDRLRNSLDRIKKSIFIAGGGLIQYKIFLKTVERFCAYKLGIPVLLGYKKPCITKKLVSSDIKILLKQDSQNEV